MRQLPLVAAATLALAAGALAAAEAGGAKGSPIRAAGRGLVRPVVEGRWLRPAVTDDGTSVPAWGHVEGLRVALHPAPGPRGLLRIYAPQAENPKDHVINFIAVEPVVAGRRGYSELEMSALDRTRGKRLWSADAPPEADAASDAGASAKAPGDGRPPARGRIEREGGVETLTVFVLVEPFANGARPYLRLRFRSDRPEEVDLAVFAQPGSARMEACILTATMGNYARLRRLHLQDRVVTAKALWPDFRGTGFAPHARFPLKDLARLPDGSAIVAAAPDETDPAGAEYAPGTPAWWKYRGAVATQYWRMAEPPRDLAVQVNGRATYWRWRSPIPGGVAFENFELVAPFAAGQTFTFGATRRAPAELAAPGEP